MKSVDKQRLDWIDLARRGILMALGEDVIDPTFRAKSTVDPLKFILLARLKRPLSPKTRGPLRAYFREWAHLHNCVVPVFTIDDHGIRAEILTKERHWKGHEHKRSTGRPR